MERLNTAISKLKKLKGKREDMYKISEESAMDQIVMILDYYDIPAERLEESEMEQAGESLLFQLIKFFRKGQVEAVKNERGLEINQTTQTGETLTYRQIGAQQKEVMDKFDPRKENYKRMYAFLGSLCGLGADAIKKLKTGGDTGQNDLACAEILGSLFLLI